MANLGNKYRKQWNHHGALMIEGKPAPRENAWYSHELDRYFIDPGNAIYARALHLAFPELAQASRWNSETLGDMFEAILGLWYERLHLCQTRQSHRKRLGGMSGLAPPGELGPCLCAERSSSWATDSGLAYLAGGVGIGGDVGDVAPCRRRLDSERCERGEIWRCVVQILRGVPLVRGRHETKKAYVRDATLMDFRDSHVFFCMRSLPRRSSLGTYDTTS
jgi:hypothetical protein